MKPNESQDDKANAVATRVYILDTTLRDGEQAPGFHLNTTAKLRIARQLERLGVDVIDAGLPSQSAGDYDACRRIPPEIPRLMGAAPATAERDEIASPRSALRDAATPQPHAVVPAPHPPHH